MTERSIERCIALTGKGRRCKCKPKGKYGNTSYCSRHFYMINRDNMHTFNDAPGFLDNPFVDKQLRNLAEKSKETMDFIQSFSGKIFSFTLVEKELISKFEGDDTTESESCSESGYFSLININNLHDITSMIDFHAQYTFKSMEIVRILKDSEDFGVVVNILYKKENIYLFIELRN